MLKTLRGQRQELNYFEKVPTEVQSSGKWAWQGICGARGRMQEDTKYSSNRKALDATESPFVSVRKCVCVY